MRWLSLRRKQRDKRYQAAELERAYRSVFLCPDGQIVLADLAALSGMYLAPFEKLTAEQRTFRDGRKALFARILACTSVTPEEHAALQEAARVETIPEDEAYDAD